MVKLNKNQTKFFIEAVNHFKENSTDVRLKDLTSFAVEYELIVPTSSLKKYCQREGLVRGHYDLTLTGHVYSEPPPGPSNPEDNIITEMSVFADPPIVVEKKVVNAPKVKGIKFRDPVYMVMDDTEFVVAIHRDPIKAFERRIDVLHDHGDKKQNVVLSELNSNGWCQIKSSNSAMYCYIIKKELDN